MFSDAAVSSGTAQRVAAYLYNLCIATGIDLDEKGGGDKVG
jgi:hypothetical protein